jgi:hypothetical protein
MLDVLIAHRAQRWLAQPDCPARTLIEHMTARGGLRDAQIEAIKTYLFLKIEGGNRPLWRLFCDGDLTQSEDLSRLHISEQTRVIFEENPAARALFEFSRAKDNGKTLLPELEKYLLDHAAEVDCQSVIKKIFYDVEYSDYLFSLPMGAGKTFLMAAFIYLDLYFAQNEPDNKTWAHNFILLVPSGLKSSIIPSLKTIENFDATWVLPEPAASNVKKLIRFEMLDQPKSASKSNKTRNPNAVKVASHQPFEELMGLVMVTNAEKVVLDRVQLSEQGVLIEQSEDEKDNFANELRNLIGKIPNLQILIDEVHHAATDDIKLRQVVNQWSKSGNINGVLGFSGTPYLSSSEGVPIADGISVKFSQITNTVFYYPLTRAIESFLKKPTVRTISEIESKAIVRRGVEEFQKQYGALEYSGGQTAKLAIYCGSIERLEDEIYPLLIEMGIAPGDILKYHRGNKTHPAPAEAESEFKLLDTHLSKKRFVLLVQIGKEGWDCRSLTGVVLSQKGDCPTNMVLQTSCRCLRQMDGVASDGKPETAGIWLNADNAKILQKQLREEQHTSIEEINKLGKASTPPMRPRFSRLEHLRLPPVQFFQMRVHYDALQSRPAAPRATLGALKVASFRSHAGIKTGGLQDSDEDSLRFLEEERGELADFSAWLLQIAKGSFGALSLAALRPFENELRPLFAAMTYDDGGVLRFNALFDAEKIASRVRLAFHDQRSLQSREEVVSENARLLVVDNLKAIAADKKNLYPDEDDIKAMRELDESGKTAEQYKAQREDEFAAARELLKAQNLDVGLLAAPETAISVGVKNKDRSFQYVPYNFDSSFELDFLKRALSLEELQERNLEMYFNGEGEITEFRIACYARTASHWSKVGLYTPDFLLVERKEKEIYRALIVETKGKGFADQKEFVRRREFVENEFLKMNNDQFGYARFDYLYLSDAEEMHVNLKKLCDAAKAFFKDNS